MTNTCHLAHAVGTFVYPALRRKVVDLFCGPNEYGSHCPPSKPWFGVVIFGAVQLFVSGL